MITTIYGTLGKDTSWSRDLYWETDMPIILWLLGAPLGLILVLWLLHVI